MKVLLLLACLLALATANTYKTNPFKAYDELRKKEEMISAFSSIVKIAKSLPKSSNGLVSKRDDQLQPGPKCAAVLESLSSDNACSGINLGDGSEVDPKAICTGACGKLIDKFVAACTGDPVLGGYVALFQIICLKDSKGNYCYSTFASLQEDSSSSDSTLTAAQLDKICTECFFKIVDLLISFQATFGSGSGSESGDDLRKYLDLLCTKADGKYCALSLQEGPFQECTDDLNTDCIVNNLDVLCVDPCFRKILAKLYLYMDPTTQEAMDLQANLAFACLRNDKQYCLVAYINATNQFHNGGCSEETLNTQGCSDAVCKQALVDLTSGMGCCLKTYLQYSDKKGDGADTAALQTALQPCGITLADACPRTGTQKSTKKFVISVAWSWAESNKQDLEDNLKQDLAGFLGIPVDDIEIISFEEATTSLPGSDSRKRSTVEKATVVNFSFVGATNSDTSSLSDDFDSSVSNSEVHFPNTAKRYAVDNPNSQVGVVSSASRLAIGAVIFTGLLFLVMF